ncbi:MAG: hypothetical protein K8S16_03725 [Bacteroidales bacterium]|nr:hypothetical protein [Bacteroidales bacterium]
MNFTISQRILWLIICNFLAYTVSGQKLETTIEIADKHFEDNNYLVAGKLYQRAIFFGSKQTVKALYGKSGDCYYYSGIYDKASKFYTLAYMHADNKQLAAAWMLNKVKCHLLSGDYQLALFDLYTLPDDLPPQHQSRKNFLLGVTFFATEDFDQSKEYFIKSIDNADSTKLNKIEILFSKKNDLKRPNPNTAFLLSTFLPGSGQFYSGNIKNGMYSLLLISGLVYVTIEVALAYTLFDAVIAVLPWLQRYYIGGMKHAEEMAIEKRAQNRNETYKEILDFLSNHNPATIQ